MCLRRSGVTLIVSSSICCPSPRSWLSVRTLRRLSLEKQIPFPKATVLLRFNCNAGASRLLCRRLLYHPPLFQDACEDGTLIRYRFSAFSNSSIGFLQLPQGYRGLTEIRVRHRPVPPIRVAQVNARQVPRIIFHQERTLHPAGPWAVALIGIWRYLQRYLS